jgi:2-polyprenyl-6-methoxyphenol hydroxylase-like FAD-dependent oxidoreductase
MKILISGGGIAGSSAALFLARSGHEIKIVDRAPSFQKRGYALSLKSFGIELMAELGLEEELRRHAFSYDTIRFSRADGHTIQSLDARVLDRATHGQIFVYRSELHATLYAAATRAVGEPRFGVSIASVSGDAPVHVTTTDGKTEDYDLVLVSEGMRSTTRALLFGNEGVKSFGVMYAAATIDVAHDLDVKSIHGYFSQGHNVAFLPVDARRLLVQCYWRAPETERPDPGSAKEKLVDSFRGFSPDVVRLLEAIPSGGDVFCDAVSQVVLPSLHRGRIVFLGDAGHCPTFLSGMGASLGLLGAKVLARALAEAATPELALARLDDAMLPVVHHFQATASKNAEGALPSSHFREVLLGWVLHFMPPSLMAAQFGKQFAVEEKLLRGLV